MKKITLQIAAILFVLTIKAQMPQLTVDGKTNNGVSLQQLKIEVTVYGSIAKTTWQMTFKNNTGRILEGNLSFPVKDGISVSRYALDINGKMREAVPVEKSKGTAVFETIERHRVDPGLLEKADGNTFRTRIYPINPNGTRTVIIGYEEELPLNNLSALKYYLPLNLKDTVQDFSITIMVHNKITPVIDSSLEENFRFENKSNDYTASTERKNYVPDHSIAFSIPKEKNIPEALMQEKDGENYFLVNTLIDKEEKPKALPNHVTILWDASLSEANRNIQKEMALLQDYFSHINNAAITLITFSNSLQSNKTYYLKNGNWDSLKNDLQKTIYDGATNFSCLDLNKLSGDEFLLFSDGHQTFGNGNIKLSQKPVYCINSIAGADFSNLKYVSQKTAAAVIDLQSLEEPEAIKLLLNVPLRFIGIKKNDNIEKVYPSNGIVTGNNFSIAGICHSDYETITLQFGFGNIVSLEKTIQLNNDESNNEHFYIRNTWAQKKITELDIQYEANKQQIEALGKRFGIATRNTSLIVLESINDYLQYQIEPPAELREEYDRILKSGAYQLPTKENENPALAINMESALKSWWGIKTLNPNFKTPAFRKTTGRRRGKATITEDEVVVVGYGTVRRKEVTGSISTVTAKQLREIPVQNVAQVLQGRVAGVQITTTESQRDNNEQMPSPGYSNFYANGQPGAADSIRIRGESSITQVSDPLYVIDGVVSDKGLDDISPKDIEKIDVLKDAAATAVYGASAANGVIVITTKNKLRTNTLTTIPDTSKKADEYSENTDYLKEIRSATKENRYNIYLMLRKYFGTQPTYFFQVADIFFKNDQKETGLKILSNLAEMNLNNYELDRMFGYKLKQQKDYEDEITVFKKILDERSGEPQSYRDYGLALEDAGLHQQAVDELYKGMVKQYDGDVQNIYHGIEEIFLPEINRIIAQHKNINTQKMAKGIIQSTPVGLRVVINWNKSNTDIDLWVTDPNEEKCYYGHKQTAMGGRNSTDFTQGFGPEQFLLKNPVKGKYRIEVNYYGDRQVTIAGPTTIMAEIYKYYGTDKEEKKVVVLQMEKGKQGAVFIANVDF